MKGKAHLFLGSGMRRVSGQVSKVAAEEDPMIAVPVPALEREA